MFGWDTRPGTQKSAQPVASKAADTFGLHDTSKYHNVDEMAAALAGLGFTPIPKTAWTKGQFIRVDGEDFHWDSAADAWKAGATP